MRGQTDLKRMKNGVNCIEINERIDAKCLKTVKNKHFGENLDQC